MNIVSTYAKSGVLFDTRPCRHFSPLAWRTRFQLFYEHTHINHAHVLLQVKVGMGSTVQGGQEMALVDPH
jgi:hypothetical protein